MNTFLPCNNFAICAKVLDNSRLLRQIQEASWVANALGKREYQGIAELKDHPVFRLWKTVKGKPLLSHLWKYLQALNKEYQIRYGVTRDHASFSRCYWMPKKTTGTIVWAPLVHASHRAKLLQKDSKHYSSVFKLFNLPRNKEPASYVWGHPEEDRNCD